MLALRSPCRSAVVVAVMIAAVAVAASGAVAVASRPVVDSGTVSSESNDAEGPTLSASNETNVTVMVAPQGSRTRLTSISAIERGREDGWVTPSNTVARGDTVVFRLTAPTISDAVANASGETDDARFRSLLGRENASFRITQMNVSPHRERLSYSLDESNVSTVVADPANGIYYVAADLGAVPNSANGTGIADYLSDHLFAPQLVVNGTHRVNPAPFDDQNETGMFILQNREVSFIGASRDDVLRPGFAAAPNQTLTGYTTLAPGSTVTVNVTSGAPNEVATVTARITRETVDRDDYDPPKFVFRTDLDLGGVERGTDIGFLLASNESAFDVYGNEQYRAPVDSPEAAVDLAEPPLETGSVRVDRAVLPDGGYVAVEPVDGDRVVGNTDLLDPGTHEDLRVTVSETVTNESLRVYFAHDSVEDGTYFSTNDRAYADDMRAVGETDHRVDPSLVNATVLVAPAGEREELSSRAATRRAQRNGWLTRTDTLAVGDTFVLKLTAPGIAETVANETGSTADERFESFLARSNTSLRLSEKRLSPSRERYHLHLDSPNVTTVVADPANHTYYVTADLTAAPWSSGDDDERLYSEPRLIDDTLYVPRLVVDGRHLVNPGEIKKANQSGQFKVGNPDAQLAFPNETAESVPVGPAPNQTITGYTNLAPGSRITIRLSNGSGNPFPVTETIRVRRAMRPAVKSDVYRFRATVDLSGAAPNSSFETQVLTNRTALSPRYAGDVNPALAPTDTPTPTASPTPTPSPHDPSTAQPTPTDTGPSDTGETARPSPSETAGTTAVDDHGFDAVTALVGVVGVVLLAARRRVGRR